LSEKFGNKSTKEILPKTSLRKNFDKESIFKKNSFLSDSLGIPLQYINSFSSNPEEFKGNVENLIGVAQIPIGLAGPLKVNGQYACGDYLIPLATTEGALVLSYDMGSKLTNLAGGINTKILSNCIHISPFFIVEKDQDEQKVLEMLTINWREIVELAQSTSKHLNLLEIKTENIGKFLVTKFIYQTGDAQGLNMINNATYIVCEEIKKKTGVSYFLRSHYSGVKHYSILNHKTGYGRKVVASITIPEKLIKRLHVTPTQMNYFFNACTKIGHNAGVQAVNVHAANAITAIFIACGQDVADISSSHVCSTYCELMNNGKDLFIQSTLYNLLVATIGGGTGLPTQKECLEIMGCYGTGKANKLAEIIAACVLAGEITTASAVINGTYVSIHNKYGRNKPK